MLLVALCCDRGSAKQWRQPSSLVLCDLWLYQLCLRPLRFEFWGAETVSFPLPLSEKDWKSVFGVPIFFLASLVRFFSVVICFCHLSHWSDEPDEGLLWGQRQAMGPKLVWYVPKWILGVRCRFHPNHEPRVRQLSSILLQHLQTWENAKCQLGAMLGLQDCKVLLQESSKDGLANPQEMVQSVCQGGQWRR